MAAVPSYVWWGLGGVALLAIFSKPARGKGLVQGGRTPRPGQRYLVQRSPTHRHRGIDVMAPAGSPVYAPLAGRVAAVWPDGRVSGYGNSVVIRHPNQLQTFYTHLQRFAPGIRKGSQVAKGQVIGYVGQTQSPRPPMQSAPHLHFEVHTRHSLAIREDNPPRLDPERWLASINVPIAAV